MVNFVFVNEPELQAEKNQKQGGMVMCATTLLIMCFVMLILLILKEIVF